MNTYPLVSRVLQQAHKIPLPIWLFTLIVLPLGAGSFGLWLLGQMEYGECRSASLAFTMADSTKLYCAQVLADQRTPTAYAEALQLANSVSNTHPLRPESDRYIQQWSTKVLDLGEDLFQEGKMDEAIKLLRAIPDDTTAYKSVNSRVENWQTTWKKGEEIFEDAQTALQDENFSVALAEARKLLRVRNQYWNTIRFQELVNQVQATKENLKKNAQKDKSSDLDKFASTKPLTTNDLLNRWQKEQESEASSHLDRAQQIAGAGDVNSLRDAIAEAQLVFSGTSQYVRAQQLIADWSRRIEVVEDRPILDRATQLASKGDLASLEAAISEANNIYFGRALYREAQSKIDSWTSQARQLHDQQYSQQLPPNGGSSFRETDYRIPPASPQ